jgi:hypothetical protein
VAFIKIIFAALEGISARREVHRGADRTHAAQSPWGRVANFPRHFGDQIPAHRVSGKKELLEPVTV